MKKVVIIGGGLAGLISSIRLAREGIHCTVIEKKAYPFHRVCGEYISNEAVPFLKSLNLYPGKFEPPQLRTFQLSSVNGKTIVMPLDLGGFGISRYTFDYFLFEKAVEAGVEFFQNTDAEDVSFSSEGFSVKTALKNFDADVVIGAFGKRSRMDVQLDRSFIKKRSPYVAVKYHIRTEFFNDRIALHNFAGGYCGISNIEDGKTNLCYLTSRENIKKYGAIRAMEEAVLHKNPLLRDIFLNADFLFDKPEVINEVSFATKDPVHHHVLMAGDAAGMITPLCGNGMAMAIHAAKILSDLIIRHARDGSFSRAEVEKAYAREWKNRFSRRLWAGRQIQRLFGNEIASNIAVNLALHVKPVAHAIIRNTHGSPF